MTKNQVAQWAQSNVTRDDAKILRVVVRNVKLSEGVVQKVRFSCNRAKQFVVARSNGMAPIRVRMTEDGKFAASAVKGSMVAIAKSADKAFANMASQIWA